MYVYDNAKPLSMSDGAGFGVVRMRLHRDEAHLSQIVC